MRPIIPESIDRSKAQKGRRHFRNNAFALEIGIQQLSLTNKNRTYGRLFTMRQKIKKENKKHKQTR